MIIVLMRKNQVSTILPILAANEATTHILFMYNNAAGFNEIVRSLGRGWASIGFPGAGGTLDGPVVRCGLIPQQPTTLGELDGGVTVRLKQVESVFEKAGFPTVISRQMDAWLKTHVAFITSVAGALYIGGLQQLCPCEKTGWRSADGAWRTGRISCSAQARRYGHTA